MPTSTEQTSPPLAVQKHSDGLWIVRLPMPTRLDAVNAYVLFDEDDAAWILDTGLNIDAESNWQEAFRQLGITPADVRGILISHYHPDHIGGSRTLGQMTGAPVHASVTTVRGSEEVWGPGRERSFMEINEHALSHGFPPARVRREDYEERFTDAIVAVPDVIEPLDLAAPLRLAGTEWQAYEMHGHAPGHLVWVSAERSWMLAGDHLLETISPAVGLYPEGRDNPLGDYLGSLEHTAQLPANHVLPGHRTPFDGVRERVAELVGHHRERIEACIAAVPAEGASANEVAQVVFGSQADPQQERFAQAEALAHLEYARLSLERLAVAQDDSGIWRFTPLP